MRVHSKNANIQKNNSKIFAQILSPTNFALSISIPLITAKNFLFIMFMLEEGFKYIRLNMQQLQENEQKLYKFSLLSTDKTSISFLSFHLMTELTKK